MTMNAHRFTVLAALIGAASCTNPVQDDAVAALGPETGPITAQHRPGQRCGVCHSASGPASDRPFAVAGTIFQTPSSDAGAAQVQVHVASGDGTKCNAVTNEAGNFWIDKTVCDPAFPLVVQVDGATRQMHSFIGRDPSCAGCHFNRNPASFGPDGGLLDFGPLVAVGQVYLKEQP